MQELSVACSVIFACGAQRISYEYLQNVLYFYPFYNEKLFKEFQDHYSMVEIFLDTEKKQAFLALCSTPLNSAANKMFTSRRLHGCQIESNGGHSLYRILQLSHVIDYSGIRLEATDHRDKIFGLLGLAIDAQELGMQPNYGRCRPKVYIEVAKALIASGHVDLLWFCQFPKSTDGLPTWTPDWSAALQTLYGDNFSESSRPFAASDKTTARIGYTGNSEGFITLQGTFVDEVDVIGSAWVTPPNRQLFQAACGFILEINLLCDEVPTNGRGEDPRALEEARWRTPIGDKGWNNVRTARRVTS